jgi:hypothetical protein
MAMAMSSLPHNLTFLPSHLSPLSSSPSSISTTKSLRNTSLFKIKCIKTEKEASSSEPNRGFDPKSGVSVYKPKSYEVLATDAANSLNFALQDGKLRLEIDFPYVYYSFSFSYYIHFA